MEFFMSPHEHDPYYGVGGRAAWDKPRPEPDPEPSAAHPGEHGLEHAYRINDLP